MKTTRINCEWTDPTLDNPILRRMPLGSRLEVEPDPPPPILSILSAIPRAVRHIVAALIIFIICCNSIGIVLKS